MGFGPLGYAFGFLAEVLSVLSPCVLPLLPVVAGTAVSAHPRDVLALTAGLAASFTLVGLFVASIGFAIGVDADWFRHVAAVLLVALGVVLLSSSLRKRFAVTAAVLASQGREFPLVALVMVLFGAGAALPMAVVGTASRRIALRARGRLAGVERAGTSALALLLIALGALELTGLDRSVEAALVNASPAWLTALTTRF